MSEKPKKEKKSEATKVVYLKKVEPSPQPKNQKILNTLRMAVEMAEERGYCQVALVLARPGDGYVASFALDDPDGKELDETQEPPGIYNLLGVIGMLRKFVEETAATSGI